MSGKLRVTLVLGKYRVTKVEGGIVTIQLGGTTTMTVPIPPYADLRPGDLVTFYTECPIKDKLQ